MIFPFIAVHTICFFSFSDIFSVAVEEILKFLAADSNTAVEEMSIGEERSRTGPSFEIPVEASASA